MYNEGAAVDTIWLHGDADSRKEDIVTVTQIDLDPELLEQASAILGTPTKKATVNEALRRVVQGEVRRAHLEELAAGALPDLADPTVMDSAWR